MSQVDQLHLLPQLFWFIVIFLGFYILYLAYVFPVIYSSFRLRVLEYRRLVNVIFFNIKSFFINMHNLLYLYYKQFLNSILISLCILEVNNGLVIFYEYNKYLGNSFNLFKDKYL